MNENTASKYEEQYSWFCDKNTCKIKYDHGPYSTQNSRFSEHQKKHSKCPNFTQGIPPNDLSYGTALDKSKKVDVESYLKEEQEISDKNNANEIIKILVIKEILKIKKTAKNEHGDHIELTRDQISKKLYENKEINLEIYEDNQTELNELITLCINYNEHDIEFAKSYLERQNVRFAHIKELGTKEQFNCWVWINEGTSCYWSENSASFILEKIRVFVSEDFNPTSNYAVEAARQISVSPQTFKVNLTSTEYNKLYQKIIVNDKGQYYDLETGKIREIDPSIHFFKDVNLSIPFKEELKEPSLIFEFLKDRFTDEDSEILLDHLAGALLHTSVLRAKPKILYIVGKTNTYKSLIIEILKKFIHNSMIAEQPLDALGSDNKFGISMIMNKMINCLEETTTQTIKDVSVLKRIVTQESGHTEVKNVRNQVYVNRYPRHLILCNKLPSIPDDDDDDSIFTRAQYIKINDIDKEELNSKDWRKILLDDDKEISRFCMWLLNRSHQIYSKEKPIKMQSLEESKQYYKELTLGDFDSFLKEKYEKCDENLGTLFEYMIVEYRKFLKNSVSNKSFRRLLDNKELFVSNRSTRYYATNQGHVFSTIPQQTAQEPIQKTVVFGIIPKKTKSDNSIQEQL